MVFENGFAGRSDMSVSEVVDNGCYVTICYVCTNQPPGLWVAGRLKLRQLVSSVKSTHCLLFFFQKRC